MAKTLKDFLNERQLGPMVVKNPDEQKFIDKHVVAKTDDRNGNDDELFKGSKVKMADRPKHRKGYNPGEDEEVYEELKGNQHKIDANKNGKVDSHDFHLLRKKKKVAEEAEELEELSTDTLNKYKEKAAREIRDADDNDDNRHYNKRMKGYTSALKADQRNHQRIHGNLVNGKFTKEEAEELEELSKATLGSYVKKATIKKGQADFEAGKSMARSSWKSLDKNINKSEKRERGINTAVGKLTKEDAEQIDEISAEKKDAYAQKAGKQLPGLFAKSNSADGARKYYNRKNAVRKIANEEADQIDEILDTPEKAANYKAKAQKSFSKNVWISGDKAAHQTAKKRLYGLSHPKVAEEVEIEEKLNMDKASMGTVIKDFQKSDAPQFQGKSQKKRQVMAIAAKLSAERGGKPLNKEERLLTKLADISETHKRTMVSVFEKLNEDNQREFMLACDTAEGIEQMLDFSIQHRGE
jgi:hypothetical protein